jgi:excinuclease ABC subunit C
MLALDGELEFDPAREEEFFGALPARPAVFLVEPRQAGAAPYLLRTADLRRRAERLLGAAEMPSKRLNLREFAARLRYRLTGSRFEQSLLFYQHARERFPQRYRALMRLRLPALLKVNLANEYPRCYVTRRILSDAGFYFGPFASRKAAEAFANDFLDLFKLRRCLIKIRRDPNFPGCIYSEMKMCLAPCFAGCTKPEYDVEVGRVLGFLGSRGTTLAREFEHERETASEALHFERAAALHRKLEKVAEILRGLTELARKVDELDAVVLQPAAEENTIALFAVRGGRITDPFFLRFGELASQPRSVEEILREGLKPAIGTEEHRAIAGDDGPLRPGVRPGSGPRRAPEELAEHLGLLARWFYSKPRKGEIFFRPRARGTKEPAAADWPYRRIIRGCSRLLAPTEPPSHTASP